MATLIEQRLSPWPSAALVAFVKRQISHAEPFTGKEQRTVPRVLLGMPVIVQGVENDLSLVGEPRAMVALDIAPRRMGLVYEEPLHHYRLLMRLSYAEEAKILAAEVRWTKPLGPFYQLGCAIIARLESFPGFESQK